MAEALAETIRESPPRLGALRWTSNYETGRLEQSEQLCAWPIASMASTACGHAGQRLLLSVST